MMPTLWGLGRLLKMLIIIFILYLLAGSVYRAVVLGKRGSEIVPNHQIWQEAGTILREFASNAWSRLTGKQPHHVGYQQI